MSKWLLALFALVLGTVFAVADVEARRFGGARSLGAQRNVTPPPARPAQQQAAPAKQGQQQAAPAGSKWGPILGGLAMGGLLGYLFAGNGLGGLLLLALLVAGAVLLWRALARRQAQAPIQFAGMRARTMLEPVASASLTEASVPTPRVPAGFDASAFLRGAKRNFVKLQLANDTGDLAEIRDFTTDELFEALKSDVLARGPERQQTDGGFRGGLEPREAGRRLERLAPRRHPADALKAPLPDEKATPAVAFCFALNHLLRSEPWARERLVPFAGEAVELAAPPLPALRFTIQPQGLVDAGGPLPSLVLHLKPGSLVGLVRGEEHALRAIDVSGNARLASEVMLLARHLRWDFEEDLSRLLGDVAAHRVAGALRDFASWHADAARRLAS
ncbi:MAG: tim44-like domain protein [Burkholderiales bacterium]|nr:tim44-like domain protein [Burkholderiales bacterium]